MSRTPRIRLPKAVWVPLGLLGVVTFAAGVVTAVGGSSPDETSATLVDGDHRTDIARAIEEYEAAVVPIVREGGKLVEVGVKVGLSDLSTEHVTAPAVVAEQAQVWRRELTALGRQLAEVTAPGDLEAAHAAFVDALRIYAEAAALVEEAARSAPGAPRDELLDRVVDAGDRADERYDEGSRLLQDLRRRSGLEPSSDFPDPDGR